MIPGATSSGSTVNFFFRITNFPFSFSARHCFNEWDGTCFGLHRPSQPRANMLSAKTGKLLTLTVKRIIRKRVEHLLFVLDFFINRLMKTIHASLKTKIYISNICNTFSIAIKNTQQSHWEGMLISISRPDPDFEPIANPERKTYFSHF